MTCEVEGCERPVYATARPLCRPHNSLVARYGDVVEPFGSILTRFMSHITETDEGCWEWNAKGGRYALFGVHRNRAQKAHRVAWELFRSEIPEGLTIDHLCRNTLCVNPWHLEPVTQSVNNARAHLRDACCRGHQRTEQNTRVNPDGSRHCRPCKAEYANNYRRKRRQEEAA